MSEFPPIVKIAFYGLGVFILFCMVEGWRFNVIGRMCGRRK